MLNNITVMGRLTSDPELRYTQSGIAVASFTLAVERDFSSRDGGEKVDWIDCVAWRHTAEFLTKYFSKGRMVVAVGRLETGSWTDTEGKNRKSVNVVAQNIYFGDSKRDNQNTGGYQSSYGQPAQNTRSANQVQGFTEISTEDDELPF